MFPKFSNSPSTSIHKHKLLTLSTLALACSHALAQTSTDTATNTLGSVVVTATRSDTTLQDMPLHTTVISRSEIENSPATSVDQLLRQVPGVVLPGAPFYTSDPTGNNITFRGMSKKVLVLVDGVPVMDPFYTTIEWFRVPLSNIDRIEIVRGGGSALWGNLAVGGVINIITKQPQDNKGELSLSGGSMGTYAASISKNLKFSDALSLNLAADGFTTNGYNTTLAGTRAAFWPGRATSSSTSRNFRIGLYFRPSDDLSGFFKAGYHVQNQDIGGYQYGSNLQQSPDFQGSLTKVLNASSRLTATVYGQNVDFNKYNGAGCYAPASGAYACGASVSGNGATTAQQSAPTLQYASSFDANSYFERGASLVYSQRIAAQPLWLREFQLGLDYRNISGIDSQQTFRTPTAALPAVFRVQRTNNGAGAQDFIGAFAQLKIRPTDRLDLTLSAREDRYDNYGGSAYQANYSNVSAPVAGAQLGGLVPSSSKNAFDPSLSARYELNDALSLRGAMYQGFRAPGLNNMYRGYGGNSVSIPNPLLGPETMWGKELGLDWNLRNFSFSATVFDIDVTNMVATYGITTATPIPLAVQAICGASYNGTSNAACPGTVSFYTNGQNQRSNGIELDARWQATRDLKLGAYATETNAYYTYAAPSTKTLTDTQMPLLPQYVGGANLSWNSSERWTQFANVRYASSMTLSNISMGAPLFRQGGYSVTDVASTYRLNSGWSLTGSVQNLFNKVYTDGSASAVQNITPGLPRTVTLSLRGSF